MCYTHKTRGNTYIHCIKKHFLDKYLSVFCHSLCLISPHNKYTCSVICCVPQGKYDFIDFFF